MPGERLVINRRSAKPIEAMLQADGAIKYDGQTFGAPSTAARVALDVGSIDGWLRWRVARLAYRTLADLRDSG